MQQYLAKKLPLMGAQGCRQIQASWPLLHAFPYPNLQYVLNYTQANSSESFIAGKCVGKSQAGLCVQRRLVCAEKVTLLA
jgi:hypothetical protein